ncbi:orientation disruptor [Musca autumnalis]|uniref:orientation disruptor n=1 Tax=Musca autumnalis TaxID=221902 RepID=UPI003CEEC795
MLPQDRKRLQHPNAESNVTTTNVHLTEIGDCPHAHLKFQYNPINTNSTFLVRGDIKSDVLQLALQLVCTCKYDSYDELEIVYPRIRNGKVAITFSLPHLLSREILRNEHSSDSDEPCTSRAARERALKRQQRKEHKDETLIKATRDFRVNPHVIEYSVNGGVIKRCRKDLFHLRFFNCADIIFPRLADLQNGDCVNGRWLDLISFDFVCGKQGINDPIIKFCEMYCKRKITTQNDIGSLTTAALTGRSDLNKHRIAKLISIFQDIRCVFEYITCSTYTVYFLLPTNFGNLKDIDDITGITEDNINFNCMKTMLQLINPISAQKFPWTDAEAYLKKLFLVAVQLAFGYHLRQNILFLHDMEELAIHQNFEYFKAAFKRNYSGGPQIIEKNYIKRIIDVCSKFDMSCVLYYRGGKVFDMTNVFMIRCEKYADHVEYHLSSVAHPNAIETLDYIRRRMK